MAVQVSPVRNAPLFVNDQTNFNTAKYASAPESIASSVSAGTQYADGRYLSHFKGRAEADSFVNDSNNILATFEREKEEKKKEAERLQKEAAKTTKENLERAEQDLAETRKLLEDRNKSITSLTESSNDFETSTKDWKKKYEDTKTLYDNYKKSYEDSQSLANSRYWEINALTKKLEPLTGDNNFPVAFHNEIVFIQNLYVQNTFDFTYSNTLQAPQSDSRVPCANCTQQTTTNRCVLLIRMTRVLYA